MIFFRQVMALRGHRMREAASVRVGGRRRQPRAAGHGNDPAADHRASPAAFDAKIAERQTRSGGYGVLAIVEVQENRNPAAGEATPDRAGATAAAIDTGLDRMLGPDDAFCWRAGRLFLLLATRSVPTLHERLRAIAHAIGRIGGAAGEQANTTPVMGYVHLSEGRGTDELFARAEIALACARSSLEIEPFRYGRRVDPATPRPRVSPAAVWRRVPANLGLVVQLAMSLVLGFGAPFILYAVCDALGSDISGPVYVGVVVVLLITATTIWVEGLLALRPTDPPALPGRPAPVATVIIPAYLPNEAATIVETIEAFLRLRYAASVQIIIAYNSPFDRLPVEDELEAIAARHADDPRFDVQPLRIRDSTSKAQNVNAVVGRVRGEFVGIFDADHHPLPDSLDRAWRWLSNGWDIVQGRCSIRNGGDGWVARMVAIEFEQIYAVSHPGRARLHGFGIFGGSNGYWRTAVLHETRMRHAMLTEDIDSSIRAVERGYRIAGDRDLVSEETAPTTLGHLLNQRLRWAQGWFQVSLRRIGPALASPHVSLRQKLGLLHLLVWRELFPWYSIQVVPIMTYWVWIYGWSYIHWTIPIFVLTTLYTVATGPAMVLFAYRLSRPSIRRHRWWFVEYLLVSTFFYAPFKDTLSRIAHLKEAMRERAWRVTPRSVAPAPLAPPARRLAGAVPVAVVLMLLAAGVPVPAVAQTTARGFAGGRLGMLIGGEASTINAARIAARRGQNAEAAALFARAIEAVPGRRAELLPEYADALLYSRRSRGAAVLYGEMLASPATAPDRRPRLLRQLATALDWSGQVDAALAAYDRLLAREPGDVELATRRAQILRTLHRGDAVAAATRPAVPAPSGTANGCPACSAPQLLAQADQLIGPDPQAATALYRRALAGSPATSTLAVKARHGLAQALTNAGLTAQAVDAWSAYLAVAPRDTRAVVQRAGLLAALHRYEASLRGFREALAIDPRDPAARRGAVDATVALARAAARSDRNAAAASLFAAAIDLDGTRPRDLLREYADQLSFSGQAAAAIPLYREVLADAALPPSTRKQATTGLAAAYDWTGRLDDAIALYAQLDTAGPEDAGVRWTLLVLTARQAAQRNANARSAELFAQALALRPEAPADIRRQYADQLSFSGHADQAIAIYRAVLGDAGLAAAGRLAAREALARAYGWSGRMAESVALYRELVDEQPTDAMLRWHLLVAQARTAARSDGNALAASLFAQAIRAQPAQSGDIAREYADQLRFTGRSAGAALIYRRLLLQPGLPDTERVVIETALAQALDWAGRYAEAKLAYQALLARAPDDIALNRAVLIVSAREAASADRNQVAAGFLEKAIALDPARRADILGEYADKLAFSGDAKAAIPLYRELLGTTLPPAETRRYALALAQALAWNKQAAAAIEQYGRLVARDPDDLDARTGIARTLSFAGQQEKAKAAYQAILARRPGDAVALRGMAQAEDWQGHHRAAQAILRQRLRDAPGDVEARRLLAQSEIWAGRPDKAAADLKLALASRPARAPARSSAVVMARNDDALSDAHARPGQ